MRRFSILAALLACKTVPAPREAPASTGAPTGSGPPVAEVQARLPGVRPACGRIEGSACEQTGDLDADGAVDRVVLVEAVAGGALGLAVLWGRGGAELLGAGRSGRWLVRAEDDEGQEAVPEDLAWLARWAVWAADGPPGRRTGFVDARRRRFAAPAVRGDGILLDGGDSAAVAYHDGTQWRLSYLGY